MENEDGTFTCVRCADTFDRRYPTGRKPLYCSATCRQRAYEDRRWAIPRCVTHFISRLPGDACLELDELFPHPAVRTEHDARVGPTQAA